LSRDIANLDMLHNADRRLRLAGVTVQDMYIILIIIQMGHDVKNSLKSYWSTVNSLRSFPQTQ